MKNHEGRKDKETFRLHIHTFLIHPYLGGRRWEEEFQILHMHL